MCDLYIEGMTTPISLQGPKPPSTTDLIVPATTTPGATFYLAVLSLEGEPVATVSVRLPLGAGIEYESGQVLQDQAKATFSGIEIQFKLNPPQVVYQRVAPLSTPPPTTSPSQIPATTVVTSTTTSSLETPTPTLREGEAESTLISRPSSTSQPTRGGTSVTGGAAAGIAIGCLIAGILIAGVVFWLYWGKRKSSRFQESEAGVFSMAPYNKKPTANVLSLESGSLLASTRDSGLPQPLEDKAISGDISKISSAIKNHVQSYYLTDRVSPTLMDHDDIRALGPKMPISTGTLSTLLENSATREVALRFCIAWVIVSKMQPHDNQTDNFLPPEIDQCLQGFGSMDRGSKCEYT